MPGESRILQTFLDGASQGPLVGLGARVRTTWAAEGLPVEPVEGAVGRSQLSALTRELRRLSIEVASLITLDPWEGRPIEFVSPETAQDKPEGAFSQRITFGRTDPAELAQWHAQIDFAVGTIEEFLQDDGLRG